ncbi:hypothetical protein chiPu_0008768 [Chiloscyllium punctatum]|uniref:Uncharacterized protein n=1 Tax=Chiloscyllium punctatum TaxID=137246 RepID=A0A401SJ06_CHIPU|nr:hypothetical protein [Chiloscyllium punctatum]
MASWESGSELLGLFRIRPVQRYRPDGSPQNHGRWAQWRRDSACTGSLPLTPLVRTGSRGGAGEDNNHLGISLFLPSAGPGWQVRHRAEEMRNKNGAIPQDLL